MNVAGQVVKEVDPHGAETLYEYDPRTLALVAQTDPLGHETRLSYDERGNCTRVDFPDGSSMEQRFHPNFNEPIALRDPNGGQWLWEYDAQGRVTGHRDPGGAVTLYRYDGARPREVLGPTGARVELRHDSAGKLAEFATLGGGTMKLQHDALGRLVGAEGPNSARVS